MPLLLQLAATDIISGQGKEACAARLENGGFEADDDSFQSFFFGICSSLILASDGVKWRVALGFTPLHAISRRNQGRSIYSITTKTKI